jgi:hypothetical protein
VSEDKNGDTGGYVYLPTDPVQVLTLSVVVKILAAFVSFSTLSIHQD